MPRSRTKTNSPPRALDRLPVRDEDGNYLAVIEASAESRNKFKFDPKYRALVLHGVLPLGTSFPYSFGFIPSTRGEDGDPLDVLLLMDEPAPPGTVVPCRLVAIIEAEQSEGEERFRNDRLIAAAAKSHRYQHCRKLSDLAPEMLDEVERFFVFYNAQKGKQFTVLKRRSVDAARAAVERGLI